MQLSYCDIQRYIGPEWTCRYSEVSALRNDGTADTGICDPGVLFCYFNISHNVRRQKPLNLGTVTAVKVLEISQLQEDPLISIPNFN